MKQISERTSRPRIGKALGVAAVALLCLGAFSQPNPAYAESRGGGGGFHGGRGFHGGGISFHGGGFHAGAVGGFHGGGFHPGFGDRRFNGGWFGGLGWGGYYPYDGEYDAVQPSYSQTWYYCSDPAGYYPYVAQCTTGWQAVPAS